MHSKLKHFISTMKFHHILIKFQHTTCMGFCPKIKLHQNYNLPIRLILGETLYCSSILVQCVFSDRLFAFITFWEEGMAQLHSWFILYAILFPPNCYIIKIFIPVSFNCPHPRDGEPSPTFLCRLPHHHVRK